MTALPIESVLPQITEAMRTHTRCLLVAQPGAGKTTRVPLALLEHTPPGQRWLLLEPRRVAARLAAAFMADQLDQKVGETIGYRVRGESRVSTHTRLEVLTQGILTRMLQDDPALDGVAGIIFDEFHERSLDADMGLALALDVQQGLREDLKLLVMSATLDTRSLLQLMGEDTPLIECPGRQWPVDTFYRSAPLREPPERHQATVIREALRVHEGHVLVFLPGQGEIRRLERQLVAELDSTVQVCPLHGQMPLAAQQAVLRPAADGKRRVILSTALAESSVTVPGVRVVVDAGRERVPVYQPATGLTRLETRRVNRASADQRRGRAGREAHGFCYRLWSEETVLAAHREAEILQSDLSSLVFELARWGVTDPSALHWVDSPPAAAMAAGRRCLQALAILQEDGRLSALGNRCARWPTHARLAAMLEHAHTHQHRLPLACWLVAWLEEQHGSSDVDLQQALQAVIEGEMARLPPAVVNAARQWSRRLDCSLEVQSAAVETLEHTLAHLLLCAYPDRVAVQQEPGLFKLISGGQAAVPQTSALASKKLLVVVELDAQATQARVFSAVALPQEVLVAHFPQSAAWHDHLSWDERQSRLLAEQCRLLKVAGYTLVLDRRPQADGIRSLSPELVENALCEALRNRGCFNWSDEDQQLLGRLRLLHRVLGAPWPDVSDQTLLQDLERWLSPHLAGLHRLDQIDRLPLARLYAESLDWSLQQKLGQLAPTHLQVPSGSRIALDYSTEEPVLAVKLQEMFGQTDTPTLVDGRVTVLVHLLSPARRPVQITRDLAGFWRSSYFEVRKDLRGRYPKHPWPDDPLLALPTARAKPHGS
jgi:ATP-dependent helicase HrpB